MNSIALIEGLKAERSGHRFRCCNCDEMQESTSMRVWVPDEVKPHDPAWSITESCKQNFYNGFLSAWCIKCASELGKEKPKRLLSLWSWLVGETK